MPTEDGGPLPPAEPSSGDDLATLARRIDRQRNVLDAHLTCPLRWRGRLRREMHGHAQACECTRYGRAFNHLVALAADPTWRLDVHALHAIHDAAVGGWEFRAVDLTVAGNHQFPASGEVPDLVESVLAHAALTTEPLAVAAARLHLDLLTIHPFLDGNGRTARLAATMWLVRGGFRCTLLTAVEQHFHPAPGRYVEVLDGYRYGEITKDACVAQLLHAMAANAMYATWFRSRERRLRHHCKALAIPPESVTSALLAYDLTHAPSGHAATLSDAVASLETPLHLINARLTATERTELAFQVSMLLEDEAQEHQLGLPPDARTTSANRHPAQPDRVFGTYTARR